MASKPEDLSGKIYGDLEIIGDTGKRTKQGTQIVIARNSRTGELYEGTARGFKSGRTTGYRGSEKSKIILSNKLKKNREKITSKKKQYGFYLTSKKIHNNSNGKTGYKNISFNKQNKKWLVNIRFKEKKYRKNFVKFEDAVMYANYFRIKNINPLITNKLDKFPKIYRENIIRNDYVKEKQKIIDSDIHLKKQKEKSRIKNAKGYCWDQRSGKWQAYIVINKKQTNLGYFNNENEAKEARKQAVEKYFNEKGDF